MTVSHIFVDAILNENPFGDTMFQTEQTPRTASSHGVNPDVIKSFGLNLANTECVANNNSNS